ncbi:deoxyuridine 5'-triphosphate nucleotidohydrolase [Candidatus Parvarchaeota archaeon]|nr:deoxyuridine 5'-triphosphate nucleotidohydrolase [Candidatus Parvarchaeota archaeon]
MILPKEEIEEQKIVSESLGQSQFQPCGVDLTLKEAHEFAEAGSVDFDNSERVIAKSRKIEFDSKGYLHLMPGSYKIIFNEYVSIPQDVAGLAFTRSTLLRNGAAMNNAVWDPGYHGRSEALLVVSNRHGIRLKKNAKLLQIVFFKLTCPPKQLYQGIFKGENKS